jgi:subtilase family serine protease
MRIVKSLIPALLLASLFSNLSFAVSQDRIAGTIDPTNTVVLKGHVSPMARPQFDQGPVELSRIMRVTMLFMPSALQQAALDKLIAQQQDETSPNYHQWITAEQFSQRFGLSQADIDKVSAWLLAQGFKITYVAHGKDYLSFEGDAGQVERAFQTELHNFNVNGKMHFANVRAPAIPAALNGIVGGFRGLHDFTPHPMMKQHPAFSVNVTGGFFTVLAPGDLATIYNINPLYQAASPIDGTGQSVVIAGQTDVYIADLNFFRSAFGLSTISGCTLDSTQTILHAGSCGSGNFQVVWPGGDPGLSAGDLGESDLDIETVSGIARKAKIIFVSSLASTGGVDTSASYAIDNQLAPVISYSYGLCEAFATAPGIAASEVEFKKASTLGISFFASSGDAAAATCDGNNGTFPAILGPSVSYPASSPEVTGVGGTEFDETGGTFWNPPPNGGSGASVISYIPELAWNNTGSAGPLDGTGGGASNCAFGTGTTTVSGFQFTLCKAPPNGGFLKPAYQTGVTLTDSVRDVPDFSFSASNANDPYIVCTPQSETKGTSSQSTCHTSITDALVTWNSAFGGTSASTPVAAGMAVLLNQYLGANGLGNINPELYKLYSSNPSVFHDISTGTSGTTGGTSDDIVPCNGATPSFEPSALRCPGATGTTNTLGFSVLGGHKYSAVTGLGSVDMNALFTAWAASSARTASSVALSPSLTNVQVNNPVTFTATVTPSTGVGSVQFSTVNNSTTTVLGTVLLNLPSAATGTAALTTTALPGGNNSVTAKYLGDGLNKASTSAAIVVTVTAPDFSIGAAPTTTSVIAGHTSGNVTVTFTPINGMNQPITPSCTGLPTGATCAFSPTPVPMDGTNPKTTTLTIPTAASMAPATTPTVMISATGSGQTHNATFSLTTTATDQSFTLAPQNANYSVTRPQSVNATLTLTPTNGFNTAVTYTCTDTVSETTCTGPSGPTTTTSPAFTITTTAPTRASAAPFGRGTRMFYAALLPGLLGIMFTVGSRKRSLRGMRMLGLIAALSVATLGLGSCSGSNSGTHDPGTPTGTHSVTVNATTGGANPVTATATINFTVN